MCALVSGGQTCALPILGQGQQQVGDQHDAGGPAAAQAAAIVQQQQDGNDDEGQDGQQRLVTEHEEGAVSHVKFRHSRSDAKSEEHTSELQSLMRISYAVVCLKKKKKKKPHTFSK